MPVPNIPLLEILNQMGNRIFLKDRPLSKYFARLEDLIDSRYKIVSSDHGGDKGEDREAFLVDLLNSHLPGISKTYRGGQILDCSDKKSSQTDIVVYSAWSPRMSLNQKPLFLAEGTFAAIEVKSVLNSHTLEAALIWSRRIKQLRKFLLPREMGIVGFRNEAKSICTGIFAYESSIKHPKTCRDLLMKFHSTGIPNYQMIDFVSINRKFSLVRMRNEDISSFASSKPEENEKSIEEIRNECTYMSSSGAFAPMFTKILDHTCYMGPTINQFSTYLYPASIPSTE